LAVSTQSAMVGNPGMAVGNVIGSNIFNIALILGPDWTRLSVSGLQLLLWVQVGGRLLQHRLLNALDE
jgi:hypothetical protein